MLNLKKRSLTLKNKIIMIAAFSLLFIFAYSNLSSLQSRPDKLLQKAVQNMETNYNKLEINIQEQGPGYNLNFSGKMMGQEIIYGNILDYTLEVYKNRSGEIYIKDLKDGIWKKAEELGLEALDNLLISPFKLLNVCFASLKKPEFMDTSSEAEKVIVLDLPAASLAAKNFFEYDLEKEALGVEFLIIIDEKKLFIEQVSISFYEENSLEKILSRKFTLKNAGIYHTLPVDKQTKILAMINRGDYNIVKE